MRDQITYNINSQGERIEVIIPIDIYNQLYESLSSDQKEILRDTSTKQKELIIHGNPIQGFEYKKDKVYLCRLCSKTIMNGLIFCSIECKAKFNNKNKATKPSKKQSKGICETCKNNKFLYFENKYCSKKCTRGRIIQLKSKKKSVKNRKSRIIQPQSKKKSVKNRKSRIIQPQSKKKSVKNRTSIINKYNQPKREKIYYTTIWDIENKMNQKIPIIETLKSGEIGVCKSCLHTKELSFKGFCCEGCYFKYKAEAGMF